METCLAYLKKCDFSNITQQLDIIKDDQKFRIYCGSDPLLTPKGHDFTLDSERVAQLIITGLMCSNDAHKPALTAAKIYAFQKDVFEQAGDPFLDIWDNLLATDPFVTVKTTGKFNFQPFGPEEELFSFAFITLSSLVNSVNEFANSSMREIILQESDSPPFIELIKVSYSQLLPEQKVVLQSLSGLHDAGIALPLVLISGIISPLEYAKGLIALKIREEADMPDILLQVVHGLDYLECLRQRADKVRQATLIIRDGESDSCEFKSTLRWDIRAGKTNQAIERASLKTIAAFLNTSGGNLLIGVRDDGSIEGIESDKFVNEDKFLLHLWTLIRTSLGRDVSPYIRTTLEKLEDKTVCVVQCRQGSRPVFLRQAGFDEAFYIRVGPSSNALDISEALKYIEDHFRSLPAGDAKV